MRAIMIVGTIWLAACASKAPPPAEPTYTEAPAPVAAEPPAPAEPSGSDVGWSEWGNCEACDYDCGEWALDEADYGDCMTECGC
jgi:hypothetical protein